MSAWRAVITSFACLGIVFLMALFLPIMTTYEEYWDMKGNLLDKPVVVVERGYEFIALIPQESSVPGYEVEIDWLRLGFQIALVGACGVLWYRFREVQNPVEPE